MIEYLINSAQCCVPTWKEEGIREEWIHPGVWLSTFTVHLKLLQYYLLISYTPIQNTKFNIKKYTNWVAQKKKEIYFLIVCSLEFQA